MLLENAREPTGGLTTGVLTTVGLTTVGLMHRRRARAGAPRGPGAQSAAMSEQCHAIVWIDHPSDGELKADDRMHPQTH
jgi:hypothetical protein